MCLVACHTAFVDHAGELAYVAAETIPPGSTSSLLADGEWKDGTWLLEWSRPLVVANGFDLQFDDLDDTYRFFVKLFEWRDREADPVSNDCLLIFVR
jgi:hypothetical protein